MVFQTQNHSLIDLLKDIKIPVDHDVIITGNEYLIYKALWGNQKQNENDALVKFQNELATMIKELWLRNEQVMLKTTSNLSQYE